MVRVGRGSDKRSVVLGCILVAGLTHRVTHIYGAVEVSGVGEYHLGCGGERGISAVISVAEVFLVCIVFSCKYGVVTLTCKVGEEYVVRVVNGIVAVSDAPLLAEVFESWQTHVIILINDYRSRLAQHISVELFKIRYVVEVVKLTCIVIEIHRGIINNEKSAILGNLLAFCEIESTDLKSALCEKVRKACKLNVVRSVLVGRIVVFRILFSRC